MLYQVIYAVHADVVHHDAGDYLIDIGVSLQQTRQKGPKATRRGRRDQGNDPLAGARQKGPAHADVDGGVSARDKLARRADIKEAGAEGEGHRKAGHDNGRGEIQHLSHALQAAGKAAPQDVAHGRRRLAGIGKQQDQKAEGQAHDNREHGGQGIHEALPFQKPGAQSVFALALRGRFS